MFWTIVGALIFVIWGIPFLFYCAVGTIMFGITIVSIFFDFLRGRYN